MSKKHLRPEDAFKRCPKCGSLDIYKQDGPSVICDSCGFLYYINAAAAVAALIVVDGKLLMTRRGREPFKGTLDLPGGFVEIEETAEDALAREIKEELNLEVTAYEFFTTLPNRYDYRGITYFTLDMFFKVEVAGIDNICAADDVAGFEFILPDDIDISHIGLASVKTIVERFCDSAQ